jgi:hypothetical protein
MKIACGLAVLIATLGAASACSSGDSSTTLPTTPSVPLTTDTISGTVPVLGSSFATFTASQSGEIDVTLTAVGPPSTISMGLAVGSLAAAGSNTCVPLSGATVSPVTASSTPQLTGTVAPGTYCVLVYDIGNQTAPVNWTATVKHP